MTVGEGQQLGVDCGAACTVAVRLDADGSANTVVFGDAVSLPSGVFVEPGSGRLVAGAAGAQLGLQAPDSWVPSPVRRIRDGQLPVGGAGVDPVALVAATLSVVDSATGGQDGGRFGGDVTLVVPAGWGPRRRTLMRQAAHRAGWRDPRLVEAPVAVGWFLLAEGVVIPDGRSVLVCDLGAGCEASVVRRVGDGFDVLATIADPDAGGDAIDRAFAMTLAAAAGRAEQAVGLVEMVHARAAKEALAQAVAVLVPTGPGAPQMVVDAGMLRDAARPVLASAAGVATRVLGAADVEVGDLVGVFLTGGSAHLTEAATVFGKALGTPVRVVSAPQRAAVVGAVRANGDPVPVAGLEERVVWPVRLRDNLGLLVPGLVSLALLVLFLATTDRYQGGDVFHPSPFLVANSGVLAMAAVFATLAALAAAPVGLGAAFPTEALSPGQARGGARLLGVALAGAAGLGLAAAVIYAVVAAAYFNVPAGPLITVTVWSSLPLGMAATVVGVLSWWRPRPPGLSWPALLRFPDVPVVLGAAGMALMQWAFTARVPVWIGVGTGERLGAVMLGLAIGLIVGRRWPVRLVAGGVFAVVAVFVASFPTAGLLGAGYVAAVVVWWLTRAARLALAPLLAQAQHGTRPGIPAQRTAQPIPASATSGNGHGRAADTSGASVAGPDRADVGITESP
jgi:hypothetical protein